MANPYVFGGASFPYEDMPFQSQSYLELEDSLVDSSMPYIDPSLQRPSPAPYSIAWTAPVQRHHKEPSTTAFFVGDVSSQVSNRTPMRPALGIHPVPPPSQIRFASPVSSIEPGSSGNTLSPPADTESYYDNLPRTPSDTALLSPFQQPLPLEPIAHAVQFRSMGPAYVNPFDVQPSQQSEYGESDNGIIDFSFPQQQYSFDTHAGRDIDAERGISVAGFTTGRASPKHTPAVVKGVNETPSQYPSPPRAEDMDSDDELSIKRQHDDDTDDDYKPSKRQRTMVRTARRETKAATTTASTAPRRTRNRANNVPSARSLTSSNSLRTPFSCSICKEADFSSQADLDAHTKKQHHRSFNCVFDFAGCDSTFASKNEWKRHVSTQHLLLHYWVCTEGTCAHPQPGSSSPSIQTATNPNGSIFNRKDLFTQHLKRMHAPQEIKEHLPLPKPLRSTPAVKLHQHPQPPPSGSEPTRKALLSQWTARVKTLQEAAIRPRCSLPALMRCPVPGCGAPPFRGQDAWNQRMEHVAKHMERAARGEEGRVVFGGMADKSLVEWAARGEVGIIVPGARGDVGGRGREWVLKSPLKRGPGGNVVVTAPVAAGGVKGGDVLLGEEGVEGEIVVVSPLGRGVEGDEEEEEDAEGEEDD